MPCGEYYYDTSISELLELIASPEKQREYERSVPIADVPSELLCQWFDDLYLPDYDGFLCCFTDSQLEFLARFNDFYSRTRTGLPSPDEGLATMQASPAWKQIMQQARITLDELEKLEISEQ